MNAHVILAAVAGVIASASFAGVGAAQADKRDGIEIRQINTAPRMIGCSPNIDSCDGATSIRTGLVVIDVASRFLRRDPVSLVAMFQASAQRKGGLLGSQLIVGGGPRLALGRSWLQTGLGFAGAQLAGGPKTIAASSVLTSGIPAVMLGVGTHMAVFEVPLQLSLDLGSNLGGLGESHFGDVYQITANVLATNL